MQAQGGSAGQEGAGGVSGAEPVPGPLSRLPRPLRNPYLLGFLVGAALVTASVPLFRSVPPAPAPIGDMPAWSLTDPTGRDVGSASLAGRTYVIVLAGSRCRGPCARARQELVRLSDRFAAVGAEMPIVVVEVDFDDAIAGIRPRGDDLERPPWIVAGGSRERTCALAQASFARIRGIRLACEQVHALAHDPHSLIVDGQGRIRASIRLDAAGLDETFHRGLAVLEKRPLAPAP